MKAAIYIREGRTQVVLTPESDWEKNALTAIEETPQGDLIIHRGSFYDCRGGWTREGSGDASLIFVVANSA